MRSEEAGGAVNQQAVDLGLASLRLGGQVNLVQGASSGGLLSLDQSDAFGDLDVALHIVDVLEGTFLDERRTRDKREEMRKYRLVIKLVSIRAMGDRRDAREAVDIVLHHTDTHTHTPNRGARSQAGFASAIAIQLDELSFFFLSPDMFPISSQASIITWNALSTTTTSVREDRLAIIFAKYHNYHHLRTLQTVLFV